jgi:hypothetical protein
MYPFLLTLHSILRWVVVILGVIAIIRGFAGWLGRKDWAATDDKLGLAFTISLDLQLLIGLVLYFFASPITMGALQDMAAAMGNSVLRFFTVEHVFGMVIAIIVAHVGRALARRATTDAGKHKRAALFYLVSLLIVLVSIPWPFLPAGSGRPWFRL